MTEQETFNTVAEHLLRQNEKSMRPVPNDKHCGYRGFGGMKCAAGCLIPDDKYTPGMEGTCVFGSLIGHVLSELGHNVELVDALRRVHDNPPVLSWPQQLYVVAMKYRLDPGIIASTLKQLGRENAIPSWLKEAEPCD